MALKIAESSRGFLCENYFESKDATVEIGEGLEYEIYQCHLGPNSIIRVIPLDPPLPFGERVHCEVTIGCCWARIQGGNADIDLEASWWAGFDDDERPFKCGRIENQMLALWNALDLTARLGWTIDEVVYATRRHCGD